MEHLTSIKKFTQLSEQQEQGLLSVYFTAGYPELENTVEIAKALQEAGADLIEIGIPYSDPVADGPTIQESNQKALQNGMTLEVLMQQLNGQQEQLEIPVILMGYFNPILQYGVERFCSDCHDRGISGLIIPDLPIQEYLEHYQQVFGKYNLENIFLITPQTGEDRIRWIDEHTGSFIYAVSDASITGAKSGISSTQEDYFQRLKRMRLKRPFLIGFGISNRQTFQFACSYASGAIIGSAFIQVLREADDLKIAIQKFVHSIKGVT
jgi:tryptophan synthase alpha chain